MLSLDLRVVHAPRGPAWLVLGGAALLFSQSTFAAGSSNASLGPLEFSVVDIRPADGVDAGYSLTGEPLTMASAALDDLPASTQRVYGWWAEARALTSGSGAIADSNGYSTFANRDRIGDGYAGIYSTSDSSASNPMGGSIVLQPGTQLTISATGAAAGSCGPSSVSGCSASSFVYLALGGAFGGISDTDFLQAISQGASSREARLMSVTYANTSFQPLDIHYAVQMNTHVSIWAPVPEPGTALLVLTGLCALARRGRRCRDDPSSAVS